ncbi:MAG: HEAT repeat domain-containing protein [Acidobacteriota bacterium]
MKTQSAHLRLLPASAVLAATALACAPAYDAQTLYDQLQSNDIEVRGDAQEKIETIIMKGDYQVFTRGAASPKKIFRAPSILYLARMEQPAARAALRDLLRVGRRDLIPYNPIRMKPSSEETDSRILVAHLIHLNGGDPEALNLLLDGVEGQPAEVLAGTCYALGALRDAGGIPFLAGAARHPDVEVVRAAAQALGVFRAPEAIEALKPLLDHPSLEVRSETLSALQLQEDPAVIDLFKRMAISDPAPEIRSAATVQLARFKDPAAVSFLIEQLKGRDPAGRESALGALRILSGQSFGAHPDQWSRWWDENRKQLPSRP